jgi:hypothetical protein
MAEGLMATVHRDGVISSRSIVKAFSVLHETAAIAVRACGAEH